MSQHELKEIESGIREFQERFKREHGGGKPGKGNLAKPKYSRERALVERYHQLKSGAPSSLKRALEQGGRVGGSKKARL